MTEIDKVTYTREEFCQIFGGNDGKDGNDYVAFLVRNHIINPFHSSLGGNYRGDIIYTDKELIAGLLVLPKYRSHRQEKRWKWSSDPDRFNGFLSEKKTSELKTTPEWQEIYQNLNELHYCRIDKINLDLVVEKFILRPRK